MVKMAYFVMCFNHNQKKKKLLSTYLFASKSLFANKCPNNKPAIEKLKNVNKNLMHY